jgi:hypothetical protein
MRTNLALPIDELTSVELEILDATLTVVAPGHVTPFLRALEAALRLGPDNWARYERLPKGDEAVVLDGRVDGTRSSPRTKGCDHGWNARTAELPIADAPFQAGLSVQERSSWGGRGA